MYNNSRLYELSFVPPGKRACTPPRIVFSIRAAHFEEVRRRLRTIADRWDTYADSYCGPDITLSPASADLFGRIEFGYGACGFVTVEEGEARFHIELTRKRLHCRTLSIKLLVQALAVPIRESASNQLQQIDLEMRCDADAIGYGHAVGGYISSALVRWLAEYAAGRESTDAPPEVLRAMRATWVAVASEESKQWARECEARITSDGRFSLVCLASSIAIFPDGTCGKMGDSEVRFSCHNLDAAVQQLTLLAGLAKLCELARENE